MRNRDISVLLKDSITVNGELPNMTQFNSLCVSLLKGSDIMKVAFRDPRNVTGIKLLGLCRDVTALLDVHI
jgi:hypothetical protein